MLVTGCALMLLSTVTADDEAVYWPYFMAPQRDLFDNLTEVLRGENELQSCIQQQEEALKRFLAMGISYDTAVLMAHSQYPCDSTDP